jgi:hypothetical protein
MMTAAARELMTAANDIIPHFLEMLYSTVFKKYNNVKESH